MTARLLAFALILLLASTAMAAGPGRSVATAEVHPVETMDGSRIYRLELQVGFGKPANGTVVEYQILTESGTIAGGGMFTVQADMATPDGEAISVLTGFGGLDMSLGYRVVADVVDAGPRQRTAQVVDTCSLFCERCGDRAGLLCTYGVSTYNCSCSDVNRSCNFTCSAGRPPV